MDYSGYLAVALSQSGATPEIVETAAQMRRAGAVVMATIRGQQLALAAGLLRGLDPDAPEGLSKVTATH